MLSLGIKNTSVFLHQSKAKTNTTVWNWSGKILLRYRPLPTTWKLSALWFFRSDEVLLANPKTKTAFFFYFILTLRRTRKVIHLRWYKGEGVLDGTTPWVFDMLQYFETILPAVESLWFSLQDKVHSKGGGADVGLWGHQTLSPSWSLSRIRNQVKTVKIDISCA